MERSKKKPFTFNTLDCFHSYVRLQWYMIKVAGHFSLRITPYSYSIVNLSFELFGKMYNSRGDVYNKIYM